MQATKKIVTHPILGNITITYNARARHIIMRATHEGISVTVPPHAKNDDIFRALDAHKDKLLAQQQKNSVPHIDHSYNIRTPHFVFSLQKSEQKEFTLKKEKNGIYTLHCPQTVPLHEAPRQAWLRKVITGAMRHRASEILPMRLKELAAARGFTHGRVSVRDSHTRWGSCNSKKDISLSIHLVLLPQELIDYVIMHELCHTIEMNHSPRFWNLLDKALNNDSKALRKRLRAFKPYF